MSLPDFDETILDSRKDVMAFLRKLRTTPSGKKAGLGIYGPEDYHINRQLRRIAVLWMMKDDADFPLVSVYDYGKGEHYIFDSKDLIDVPLEKVRLASDGKLLFTDSINGTYEVGYEIGNPSLEL